MSVNSNTYSNMAIPRQTKKRSRRVVNSALIGLIKSMLEEGDSPSKIARVCKIGVSTVFKWKGLLLENNNDVDVLSKTLKKPGRTTNPLSFNMIKVSECVQSDLTFTQKGIQKSLEAENILISQSSISLCLRKLEITRKRLQKVSERVLSPAVIAQRKSFSLKYRNVPNSRLLYLDETGFNLHTMCKYGYSPKNIPAKYTVPANRGRNISLLTIISNDAILHSKLILGPYNSVLFLEFLNECHERNIFGKEKIILMDNVKFHKTQCIKDFFSKYRIKNDYLPPYSPALNPIEEVFSSLKARYYQIRPYPQCSTEVLNNVRTVIEAMNSDLNLNINNFYINMRRYMDLAFIGEFF